ncbi:GntR family transcriptional regulator [Ovoidimarina sediminis]|uniref:GntR family transcriptional regulator n=1 Tax=Ovoidimarina sediminis TaxID=3079856 RepID=UPI0029110DFF|nr:GntR family transcriptional regulator [Rhodophyticola sp. MJ-SS7]MDU8944674.1 GntR family transcriptional regulator [Rhodophyticola sp. MJ-SS7]
MGDADRISQVQKATLGLRGMIMSGEFGAGARLPEVALSERLGISRTPLRQAMDRLESEGLLERMPSGGCRVASFDLDDINDAIELRGVVEGTAARLAAERGADPELMTAAEQVLNEIDIAVSDPDSVDFDAYVGLNARFHEILAGLAGSAVIRREAERISNLPLASPSAFLRGQEVIPDFNASLIRAQGQHKAILEAISNREGARAEALAREHARLARLNFAFLKDADPRLATRIPGLALVTAS